MCWCSSFSIESKQWQKDALRLSHACKWCCWPHDLASPSSAACVYTTKSSKALLRLQELIPSFVCSLLASFSQAMAGKPVYLKLLPKRYDTYDTCLDISPLNTKQERLAAQTTCRTGRSYLLCSRLNSQTDFSLLGRSQKTDESLESLSHLGCWLNSMQKWLQRSVKWVLFAFGIHH